MHKLMAAQSAVGATDYIRVPKETRVITVRAQIRSRAATKISVVDLVWEGSHVLSNGDTGLISNPLLVVGTTAENVRNYPFAYRIAGVNYTKAAVAAGTVLSAVHEIDDEKWGGFKVYIDATGAVTTKQPGATQVVAQAYATAALAQTAIDGVVPEAGVAEMGRVLISMVAHGGSGWTGKTDDMTNASDVTTATFTDALPQADYVDSYQFDPSDLSSQSATWNIENTGERYGRLWLRTLTGTGDVTCHVSFR